MSTLKKISLALFSAILFSLPWITGFCGTLFVAFVPLFMLQKQCKKGFLWWAALTFFVWIMATCWWVSMSTIIALFAVPLVGLCFTFVPFAIYHWIYRRGVPKVLGWVLFVSLWLTFEAFYMYGDISFPWLTLGYGFAGQPSAVQWYSITGSFGGSLWVLVSNVLVFCALQNRSRKMNIAIGAWIVLPLLASWIMYFTYNEKVDPVQVTVVQPNIDPYNEKFGSLSSTEQQNIMLRLAEQAPPTTQFIVLPETALPYVPLNDWQTLDTLQRFMTRHFAGATMVTGATTYDARKIYNSALWIDSSANVEYYHKAKLVCGVEMIPYPWLFNFLRIDLGGVATDLGRSDRREIHDNTGVAICYEAVYGEFYTQYVRNGAQLMFIISNDGWWGDTPGYHHLLHFASLRAIETRRSIARSANTGISAFIDQRGCIVKELAWDERGILSATLNRNSAITPYVLIGDLTARIAIFTAALCLLYALGLRFRHRQ